MIPALRSINEELSAAEQALADNRLELELLELEGSEAIGSDEPPLARLQKLEQQSQELLFVHHVSQWGTRYGDEQDVLVLTQGLEKLGDLLVKYRSGSAAAAVNLVYEQEFGPLYQYVKSSLHWQVRQQLKKSQYPLQCHKTLHEWDNESELDSPIPALQGYCQALAVLADTHKKLTCFGLAPEKDDILTLEVCRPFVERFQFLFLQEDDSRPMSKRIERLPAWLREYMKQVVFDSGAWDLLQECLSTDQQVAVINELIRILQWILQERQFFRDPLITGPHSKPLLLINAIEQLLQADHYLASMVDNPSRLVHLLDVCVAGDDELFDWWLDRERENAFRVLFDEEVSDAVRGVAARSEIFTALVRSIHIKARQFQFSGPYMNTVVSPLCVHFIEAIQDTAQELLFNKGITSSMSPVIAQKVKKWMELLNGVHFAMAHMASYDDEELVAFAGALEKLQAVLLQDFCTGYVDLMERFKLASYIMRCSFLVAKDIVDEDGQDDLSPELEDTLRLMKTLFAVCSSRGVNDFAPTRMRDQVVALLAERFLSICLDVDGMTPDLRQPGCALFYKHVEMIFSSQPELPQIALRVMDVAKVMSLPPADVVTIGNALCGLADQAAPLEYDVFDNDDRLFQEGTDMIRAKGLLWLELSDLLPVLNRRRDLLG